MADEPQIGPEENRKDSFVKEMSRSAVKRALAPLAATAATAGMAYLTRKTKQIWNESLLPKIDEKGGGKAFAKDALEQVASKLGGRGSDLLSGFAKRLDDQQPTAQASSQQRERAGGAPADDQKPKPDPRREQERRERQRRRQQRQRALEQSGST